MTAPKPKLDTEADALLTKYGTSARHGPTCGVERSEHRALIEALSARGINSVRISLILRNEKKANVGPNIIRHHVSQSCACVS